MRKSLLISKTSMPINSHQPDNILPLKCSNAPNHFIDLCLVRIKLAQFNAFYCWERKSFFGVSQTNNQRTAATLHCFKCTDFNCRDFGCSSFTSSSFLPETLRTFSSSLRSLHQIAIMHVLSSALCDAPHCVSGTLNFITFGTIPFLAFALSCKKERVYHGRMLLENEPKRENVSNRRRIFISKCSCCVFNTWKIYFQEGLICVFPWIHITTPPLLLTHQI